MKTKILFALALSLTFATAYAQSEEQVLNSDPIDVDGYMKERQVTDGELEQIKSEIRKQKTESVLNKEKSKGFKELSKQTEKLSETTEEYLDEKKSAQKDIAEYNAKIKCLMEENPGVECDKYIRRRNEETVAPVAPVVQQEVAVAQAAPAAVSAIEVPAKDGMGDLPFETIKMGVDYEAVTYRGQDEELTADGLGLNVESNINNRFSIGFGVNYAMLSTQDYANDDFNDFDLGYGNYGGGFGYEDSYGSNGREINYSKFGFDVNGKFFITQGQRFRPFVGVGLGYNMATLKYAKNNEYQYDDYDFGNEEYKTNFATGRLMIGTEIMFTRAFGMTVLGSFSKGFAGSSSDARNRTNSPDQRRLGQLGEDIVNSNMFSLSAGMVFVF